VDGEVVVRRQLEQPRVARYEYDSEGPEEIDLEGHRAIWQIRAPIFGSLA
jgi:hypothetical protein